MRCPKCHYLSFDPEPRCRNCGYELSLAERDDLSLEAGGSQDVPLEDLILSDDSAADGAVASPLDEVVEQVEEEEAADEAGDHVAQPPVQAAGPQAKSVTGPATGELPLFVRRGQTTTANDEEDAPPLPVPGAAGPPLSVRRRVTEPVKPRPEANPRKLGPLDRDLLEDLERLEHEERRESGEDVRTVPETLDTGTGAGVRLGAAAIDLVFIGLVSVAVLGVTLRWCNLPMAQVSTLPIVPTSTFLLLVCLGYLFMFTAAAGQTLGKMAVGIRVVSDGERAAALTARQAFYRETLAISSVLMLGSGFIPGLLGDHRALHDRLAHTRVVRA